MATPQHTSSARFGARSRSRAVKAAEVFASASAAIGPIEPGMHLFLITRGQFSMLDMVKHVLAELGPSQVSIWTWAIADYEVEAMVGLMQCADIVGARLIVDRSAEFRSAGTIEEWRQRFGQHSVRVCKNHAKIARVWNGEKSVLLRGSMNLNFNPRFEQADITEGGEDFELVTQIENELPVLPALCSNTEADTATGLGKAYEQSTLAMFGGLKVWAK
jgi:hypothetical protein